MKKFIFSILFLTLTICFFSCNKVEKTLIEYETRVNELETLSKKLVNGNEYEKYIAENPTAIDLFIDGFEAKTKEINESSNLTQDQKTKFFALHDKGTNAKSALELIIGVHTGFAKALDTRKKIIDEMEEKFITNNTFENKVEFIKEKIKYYELSIQNSNIILEYMTKFTNFISINEIKANNELSERESDLMKKIN